MSFKHIAWAVEQPCTSPGAKLVLLMLASHTNGHTRQCNPSHKLLAAECCMGVSTLKNHLVSLAEAGFIKIISQSYEGVSLPNHYQIIEGGGSESGRGVGQNLADGGSESGRGVGQNLATKLEGKPGIETLFGVFWNKYPRKAGKDAAFIAFEKRKPDEQMLDEMLKAIELQSESDAWQKNDGQYIPHPSTWLNQGRWKDEQTNRPTGMLPGAI